MKRLLLITSAVGLCLAAPAFAQYSSDQEQMNRQKAAPPSSSAPAAQSQDRQRSNQQQPDQSDQAQQRPATGSSSPSAQAPSGQSQSGQAQNQQQPSSRAPASSAQAPASSGQAQSPAADQTQRGQAQNQRDPAADKNRAQRPADQQQQDGTKAQAPADHQQQDRTKAQAPADQQQQRSATDRNQPAQSGQADRRQSRQDMQRQDRRQDAQNSRTRDRASASLNVNINETQRTRIATAFSRLNVRPVNVNFRIATGVVVPRTVVLHTLPVDIVEIAPQFRGYSYFATNEQIVIVEPRRKTIVAVLPAGGTARAQAPAESRARFTDQQREVIRSRASTLRSTATTGSSSRIVIEEDVPTAIELEEFPAEIVTEVPVVRTYRYFRQDNDVFVVDPVQRRVIEVIR